MENDGDTYLQLDDVALVTYRNGTIAEGNVTTGSWHFTGVSDWTAQVFTTQICGK